MPKRYYLLGIATLAVVAAGTVLASGPARDFIAAVRSASAPAHRTAPPDTTTQPSSPERRAPFEVQAYYYATGWMGDGELRSSAILLNAGFTGNPRPGCRRSICTRIEYRPGPIRWAGVFWLNYPDNWGDRPGTRVLGAKRLTFWAAGESGEEVVEFKAGGIHSSGKRYRDSFEVTTGMLHLGKEWRKYEIDLTGADLSSVIGAFAWVATADANPKGVVFYLDEVRYE
jgi:hypothetical protein